MIIGIARGIRVDIYTDVNVNVLAAVMTVLDFIMSISLEARLRFSSAGFTCDRPRPSLDCSSDALQAWMPSYHVWSCFALPGLPQCLNQEPPRLQQLRLPNLPMVPHLGHPLIVVVVLAAVIYMMMIGHACNSKKAGIITVQCKWQGIYIPLNWNLRLQASTPSNHL